MSDYRYGTQSDAYAAEHDVHPRTTVEKKRKTSLSQKLSGDDGAPNDADNLLQAMGYKAELVRSRSTFQVAFMSFVLASVPYGLATTLYYPIACAGPVGIIWGWLGVSLIILCVAASLGEITSVYPTRIASWICGWAFVVGNITITLAVNFATALFLGACINVFETEPGVGIFAGTAWQTYLIFLAITILCNLISALGNRYLPWLDVRFLL
jgi:amino acid permease